MILKLENYNEILLTCQLLIENYQLPSLNICERYQIEYDTIISICNQLYIKQIKKLLPFIEQDMENIQQRVQNGELLIEIAKEKKFSSYKLAKMYVEQYLPSNFKLQRLLIDYKTDLIHDSNLISDLIRCCTEDPYLNHKSEPLKKCAGDEYEELLYQLLREHNVSFETEVELRLQGKSKTPDALLLFPIGVKIDELSNDWQIIHWIDSKAMFGDVTTFEQNSEQLQGYVNRYGKGLVIFWHGFVDVIAQSSGSIIVSDKFPPQLLFPGL